MEGGGINERAIEGGGLSQARYPKYYTHIYFNTPLGDWVVTGRLVFRGRAALPGWCRRDNGPSELH